MRARFSATGLLVLAVSGCGGSSPAAPSAAGESPLVTAGAYVLTIIAPDQSVVGGRPAVACFGAGPAGLALIVANATVTVSATDAHAKPATAADGSFDLRLAWNGSATSAGIRGVVINTTMPLGGPLNDARAAFDTPTEVPLVIVSKAPIVGGTVFGSAIVSNSTGTTIVCNPGTAQWSLSKVLR